MVLNILWHLRWFRRLIILKHLRKAIALGVLAFSVVGCGQTVTNPSQVTFPVLPGVYAVEGVVTARNTKQPVANVTVELLWKENIVTVTDANGHYIFNGIPFGQKESVIVRAVSLPLYQVAEVMYEEAPYRSVVTMNIQLVPIP